MSRYFWIHPDFEEIEVGDEMIITNYSRWSDTRYAKVAVTKVTAQQFTTDDPNGSEKPMRFMRSNGNQHGSGGYYRGWQAKPATEEAIKEMDDDTKRQRREKRKKAVEADAKETKLRERYGALTIENEGVQEILKRLRAIAESGRKAVKQYAKEVKEASTHEAWKYTRALDWNGEEKLRRGIHLKDQAEEAHQSLVGITQRWYKDIEFKDDHQTYSREAGDDLIELLKLDLKYKHDRLLHRLLDSSDEPEPGEREFIKELRELSIGAYPWNRVRTVASEEDDE